MPAYEQWATEKVTEQIMQPFSVICESCRTQLSVRTRRKIGEIHPCPKCGGMVLIQPPAGWTDTPSEASTTFAALQASATDAKPRSQSAPPSDGSSFFEVADLSGIDLTTPAGAVPSPPPVALKAFGGMSERILWGSMIGGTAIVTAGLVWALWPGKEEQAARAPQSATVVEAPSQTTLEPKSDLEQEAVAETVANKPEITPEPTVVATPPEFTLPEPPRAGTPQLTQDVVPPVVAEVPPAPAETPAAPAQPAIDLRDIDPENIDLVLRKHPQATLPAEAVATNNREKPADAPEFRIERGGEEATLASLEHALSSASKEQEPQTVRRGPTSAEDAQTISVDHLLKATLVEIDAPNRSLAQAVAMLSELTGIPITLDPTAMRMAGVSADHKVTLRGKNVPAAELIRTTLVGAKLHYERRGEQLIVVRAGGSDLANRDYKVADLLRPGGPDATELAKWIQTLVAPESWSEQGGKGQLKASADQLAVTQTQAIHYDALIFCERLRKVRGLPIQSRYPTALLRSKPLEAELAPQFAQRTTFSFVSWTPLREVFRHWEKTAGFAILIDWSALADVDLAPNSTIACAVEDTTWREALDDILTPLGLAWIPVDEKTIQITSRAAAESQQYIDFYPLAKSSDAEIVVAELLKQIPDGAVVFDNPSRSIIVRANAAGQRHVATHLSLGDQ